MPFATERSICIPIRLIPSLRHVSQFTLSYVRVDVPFSFSTLVSLQTESLIFSRWNDDGSLAGNHAPESFTGLDTIGLIFALCYLKRLRFCHSVALVYSLASSKPEIARIWPALFQIMRVFGLRIWSNAVCYRINHSFYTFRISITQSIFFVTRRYRWHQGV